MALPLLSIEFLECFFTFSNLLKICKPILMFKLIPGSYTKRFSVISRNEL